MRASSTPIGSYLIITPIDTAGWHVQKLLKLEVAKRISTERYVILDAKNHLCYPVSQIFSRGQTEPPRLSWKITPYIR